MWVEDQVGRAGADPIACSWTAKAARERTGQWLRLRSLFAEGMLTSSRFRELASEKLARVERFGQPIQRVDVELSRAEPATC